MRTFIAYLTSTLVHVAALAGLAYYLPVEVGPCLDVDAGITIVAAFSVSEVEVEAAVVVEAEPLPQEARPVETELEITPAATKMARKEIDTKEIIPVQAVPAEQDETPPPQAAAKQTPNKESPPQELDVKSATKQSKPAPEIAQHSIAIPFQAAASAGANVDHLPREFRSNRPPLYPPEEARAGVTGVVLVRCAIAASGFVDSAVVEKSSGSERLDEAALTAVRTWQFEPARRGGVAVTFEVIKPVRFLIR